MKKKYYLIASLLIIFTTVITSVIFQGYRKVEEFNFVKEEIANLEESIFNEDIYLEDKNKLKIILEDYSRIMNLKIIVNFKDGDRLVINDSNKNTIYNHFVDRDNNLFDSLSIYLYEEVLDGNFIKSLISAIIISLIIALFFVAKFIDDDSKVYDSLMQGIEKSLAGYPQKLDLGRKDEKILGLETKFNLLNEKIFDTINESREINTRLRSIISSMKDGVLAIDVDGNIILSNDFVNYIFDLNKIKNLEELSGQNEKLLSILDGDYDKEFYLEFEYPIYKKVRVTKSPIIYYRYSNKKLGDLFIFEDITKMDRLEKVREDFVANVSHELKTPLTSILGFVETLESGAIEDKEFALKFLGIIEEEVLRMNILIEDLLLLSEIESGKLDLSKERVDLVKLIDEVFMSLKYEGEKNKVKLEKNISYKEFFIYSNENYLRQVLINLIANSIKYNKPGGYVSVGVNKAEDYFYIDILDNGLGMEISEKERVFERFYRVDKSRSKDKDGTGLGLSIVRHIVSIFNGSIYIESSPGIGSLVTVKLPME